MRPLVPRRALTAFAVALVVVSVAGCGGRRATDSPRSGQAPGGRRADTQVLRADTQVLRADTQVRPYFRDVAAEAGLDFRWGHGGKSPLTILETVGHGCAFLDYDQDGRLDVFLVGNRKCALFRNMGSGRFSNVTEASGLDTEGEFWGVAAGDYDNDGYPDLYVTGYGKCVLYQNVASGEGQAASGEGQAASGEGQAAGAAVPKSKIQNPKSPGGRRFEDVTVKAGLAARGPYDVATAAAFADLDGDGKLDLFAGRYIVFTPKSLQFCTYSGVRAGCGVKNYDADRPRVYRNNGDGTFMDVTYPWGFGSAHGKCLGVAVRASDSGAGVELYAANDELPADYFARRGGRGEGKGERGKGKGESGRGQGAGAVVGAWYVERGTSSGVAYNQDGLTQGGMGTDWGDFDNDGRPDLVVSTFQGEANSLYRAEGASNHVSTGRVSTDDNRRTTARSRAEGNLELGTGASRLTTLDSPLPTRYTEVGAPMGIAIATTPLVAWTAKFFDFDNDRWLDLLFTNGHTQDNVQQTEHDRSYPQKMLLFHNEQGKRMAESGAAGGAAFTVPFVGRGAAAGDFDNDGRVDLLVVDEEGPVKLLKNEDDSGRHWLGVKLVGGHCNRDGIGARIFVTADGMTTVRDQQLAGGYISAHDPRVHFGLGKATRIDKLVVRWPCGRVDVRKDLPADRYVTCTEGR